MFCFGAGDGSSRAGFLSKKPYGSIENPVVTQVMQGLLWTHNRRGISVSAAKVTQSSKGKAHNPRAIFKQQQRHRHHHHHHHHHCCCTAPPCGSNEALPIFDARLVVHSKVVPNNNVLVPDLPAVKSSRRESEHNVSDLRTAQHGRAHSHAHGSDRVLTLRSACVQTGSPGDKQASIIVDQINPTNRQTLCQLGADQADQLTYDDVACTSSLH